MILGFYLGHADKKFGHSWFPNEWLIQTLLNLLPNENFC